MGDLAGIRLPVRPEQPSATSPWAGGLCSYHSGDCSGSRARSGRQSSETVLTALIAAQLN